METVDELNAVSLDSFRTEWLADVTEGSPSTVELGRRFAKKVIGQWLDFSDDTDDVIYCDGSGDGGIDLAYLLRGDGAEENANEGDTWYLVQSKYGSAFTGTPTLLIEAQKIIDTLDGSGGRLSSLTTDLVERLRNFRSSASAKDRLILVFATVDGLSEAEKRALDDIRALGRSRLGEIFDTDSVSVQTIYQRSREAIVETKKYRLPLRANLVSSGEDLLVGSVSLTNLFQFLKSYKKETGDLDLIYEKNVRRFLGAGKKVNAGIAATLRENPARFGLYNNGITLVVEDFEHQEENLFNLTEPYIVNGCQTTRTIWDTLYKRLDSGGTGTNEDTEKWRAELEKGIVVVKVVKVGADGEELLTKTTRYTNSQNAVGQKDFIALEQNFKAWAREMAKRYDVFLEIQRGGWDSQRALQRTAINAKQFTGWANSFDLLKIYGAAWLNEPGYAFGKNPPFAPGGTIFKRIMESDGFGVTDLYAAYLLDRLAQYVKFGRGAEKSTRGQTRFLFYHVLTELLKDCMMHSGLEVSPSAISQAVIKVFFDRESEAARQLTDAALTVIDEYLTRSNEDSIYTEPRFSGDLNSFLKWEKLAKGNEHTPKLSNLIAFTKRDMRRSIGGQLPARDLVCDVIRN